MGSNPPSQGLLCGGAMRSARRLSTLVSEVLSYASDLRGLSALLAKPLSGAECRELTRTDARGTVSGRRVPVLRGVHGSDRDHPGRPLGAVRLSGSGQSAAGGP